MSTPDGFSDNPLCAEMERRCAEMILVSQAVTTCADVFEQACEPRAPKPEWFGTGEGQWDSWCIVWADGSSDLCRRARWDEYSIAGIDWEGSSTRWTIPPDMVVPVARTGYPSPVGWKVVGE